MTPGATPGAPSSDAIVLFDGKDLSKWVQRRRGEESSAQWPMRTATSRPALDRSLYTRETFRRRPTAHRMVGAAAGRRPQSGPRQQRHHPHGPLRDPGARHGRQPDLRRWQAGAIYGQWPPLVNAPRKPGEWQIYDIVFEAPSFEGDKLVKPAFRPSSGTASSSTTARKCWAR